MVEPVSVSMPKTRYRFIGGTGSGEPPVVAPSTRFASCWPWKVTDGRGVSPCRCDRCG